MNIIVLELVLVAVVAFGLGFWQLRDVNRALREHRDDETPGSGQDADSKSDGDAFDKSD